MLTNSAVLQSGQIRREVLNGRDYLVAPLTMIVPGVLNGSKGPLYYPLEEIAASADSWNNIPIVVQHPVTENGTARSARNPEVLRKSGVGSVYNAQVRDKLVAEGWFDVERLQKVSPSTYEKLVRGQPEELSTGLFTDNFPVKNGKTPDGSSYVAVARNYRPDHLAILPDRRGACSIEDGCGVNINQAAETSWYELVTNSCCCKDKQKKKCDRCKKEQEDLSVNWWQLLSGTAK